MIDDGLPPKPAIIRPAEHKLLRPHYLPRVQVDRYYALRDLRDQRQISESVRKAMFLVPPIGWKTGFTGGDLAADSVYDAMALMATGGATAPSAEGTLTIDDESLGSYDVAIFSGDVTVSSFSASTYFTSTEDSRAAFVIFKNSLTVNSGQVFKPAVRKLFCGIYVKVNCAVNGEISMSARGANHSAAAGNVTAAAIRIINGTHGGVLNPQVPAAGAAGGTSVSDSGTGGLTGGDDGDDGTAGQTGGGGGGAVNTNGSGTGTSGTGAAGTSFSGGPGGGAAALAATSLDVTGGNGGANGAAGGAGDAVLADAGGGAGNPGGADDGSGSAPGSDGSGGVLIGIVEGDLSGAGSLTASGANGGAGDAGGGGSGGGSNNWIIGGTDSGPVPTATGGSGGAGASVADGGDGGDGTARKLAMA